jgi:hypothetical protein
MLFPVSRHPGEAVDKTLHGTQNGIQERVAAGEDPRHVSSQRPDHGKQQGDVQPYLQETFHGHRNPASAVLGNTGASPSHSKMLNDGGSR